MTDLLNGNNLDNVTDEEKAYVQELLSELSPSKSSNDFIDACAKGNLVIVQDLWNNDKESKQEIDLNARADLAFRTACGFGHLHIAKWLINIPNNGIRIDALNNDSIKITCVNKNYVMLKWLLYISICGDHKYPADINVIWSIVHNGAHVNDFMSDFEFWNVIMNSGVDFGDISNKSVKKQIRNMLRHMLIVWLPKLLPVFIPIVVSYVC